MYLRPPIPHNSGATSYCSSLLGSFPSGPLPSCSQSLPQRASSRAGARSRGSLPQLGEGGYWSPWAGSGSAADCGRSPAGSGRAGVGWPRPCHPAAASAAMGQVCARDDNHAAAVTYVDVQADQSVVRSAGCQALPCRACKIPGATRLRTASVYTERCARGCVS